MAELILNTTIEAQRQRMLGNKHFAAQKRAELLKGYHCDSTFVRIVKDMSDDELINLYFDHLTRHPHRDQIRARSAGSIFKNEVPQYVMVADRQS